jgi:hypothetical protein
LIQSRPEHVNNSDILEKLIAQKQKRFRLAIV